MSIGELILKRREQLKNILEKNIPLKIAVLTTVNAQANRIFIEAKNSHGSLIGHGAYNDNKPLYVDPNKSPVKFKTAGKPFEFRGRRGKLRRTRSVKRFARKSELSAQEVFFGINRTVDHKTRWFSSYKDFRQTINRRVDKVNLTLSNDFASDFKTNPGRINQHEFVTKWNRSKNALKASGMTDKYGDVFKLTKEEKKLFYDTLQLELKKVYA